ncbi:EF-hand domain-containing protein [Spirillospora sp. NPDC050679]
MTTQTSSETSGVLSAKLDRIFGVLDSDGDGRLAPADLGGLAARLAEEFDRQSDRAKIHALERSLLAFWHSDLRHMDTDGDGTVDRQEFATGLRRAFADDPGPFLDRFGTMVDAWMGVCDTDGDGLISKEEYVRMYRATLGFPEADLRDGFDRLDRDGDGRLDREEIRRATYEYYTSDDAGAPGNWLFGPL